MVKIDHSKIGLCGILLLVPPPVQTNVARRMSLIDLNLTWFRCYSKAKFSDPKVLHINVQVALEAANNALIQAGLAHGERKAIVVAIQDLQLMEREGLPTFRRKPPIGQNRMPIQQAMQK